MIHRAIAGSLERFLSVIIEHYAGSFPLWLAPEQVYIIPIKETHADAARKITESLKALGFRTKLDMSDEGFGKKVRAAKNAKAPYTIIIGDKDMEAGKVTLESRDNGNLGQLTAEEVIAKLSAEIAERK